MADGDTYGIMIMTDGSWRYLCYYDNGDDGDNGDNTAATVVVDAVIVVE